MSRKARDMGTRVWWNSTHPNILLLRGADLGHPPGASQVPQFVPSASRVCPFRMPTTLTARKADISSAISTGHIMCYRHTVRTACLTTPPELRNMPPVRFGGPWLKAAPV